ncbi:porin [Thorsellia anophelis]|uniref:Outer membrane pore protein F n=1 Tax=Thorsellia anophelis DSM 18579 TaxID=1123402 RepID=A0A1H9ZJQ5_9GAMM|nr:porin [Thorsellia anophelis]SES81043.1 outer membrane pore protein F [Thorsellia anophelis DSM 18579]
MKRKILALAITSLLASNGAMAAEIYNKDGSKINLTGRVAAIYTFKDDKAAPYLWANDTVNTASGDRQDNDNTSYARLGFSGETQINSMLTGYAKFEHNFKTDNAEDNNSDTTRLAYVGLNYDKMGSLDFGRNYGVVSMIRDFTDASNFDDLAGKGFTGTSSKDVGMLGRASSLATYSNKDTFGMVPGLDFYLQYQAKNAGNASDLSKKHGDGFGIASTYEHEDTGLGFGATYAKHDRIKEQQTDNIGNNAEVWGVAAKYDGKVGSDKIYAAVSWAETNNLVSAKNIYEANCGAIIGTACSATSNVADKTSGIEAIFKYTFDLGNNSSFTPQIVYNQTRGKNLNVVRVVNGVRDDTMTKAYLTKFVTLGAGYRFNKNIDTSLGYKINLVDEEAVYTQQAGLDVDDRIEMRLTYSF